MMVRIFERTCRVCGASFTSRSGHSFFCGNCRAEQYRLHKNSYLMSRYKHRTESEYTCQQCGSRIHVYGGRTSRRKTCTQCLLQMGAYGRQIISQRKELREEVVGDAGD